ncbi:MAG TPA: nitrite reductase small subunit NirD [Moraxellaceae bacterium]|nr:nitrite reductase small subunit NirD [Moraxellaceae bacterium]
MNMNARSNLADTLTPVEVCRLDDLVPGIGVCALVNGQQVALFRLRNGDIHAIGNHDPFSGANVISRGLTGDLKGRKVVASPLYKQHFDLATGECLEDPAVRLPTWPVQVTGDRVCVLA